MEQIVEKEERSLSGVDERLKTLIDFITGKSHRSWKILEENTSIKAEKWRQFYRGTTRASGEMVGCVARKWPDYAYWLACGDTEPERGHIAPPTAPERFPIVKGHPQEWATAERAMKQQLLALVPTNDKDRLAMEKALRDQMFAKRQTFHVPAIPIIYEKIMRALDEEATDEIFLLELNDELRKIREKRWQAEKTIQHAMYVERDIMDGHILAKRIFEYTGVSTFVSWVRGLIER